MALLCLPLIACGGPADTSQHVDIAATDGVVLKGSYFSPGKRGPGIVLFHQGNMDRHAWDSLAGDLTAAGIHVLTVDQRGLGDSGGRPLGQIDGPKQGNDDADAAYAFLISRPDVDRSRVAAGGASSGVPLALDLAHRHAELEALVLMSGYTNKDGLAFIASTPALPIFGAVNQYDNAAGIQDIVSASKHPNSTLKVYPSDWFDRFIGRSEHGVALFRRNHDLRPAIVSWLLARVNGG